MKVNGKIQLALLLGSVLLGDFLLGQDCFAKPYTIRVRLESINSSVFYVDGTALEFQGKISPFQKVLIPPKGVQSNLARVEHSVQLRSQLPFDLKVGLGVIPHNPIYDNSIHKSSVWRVNYHGQDFTYYTPLLSLKGKNIRVDGNSVPDEVFLWPKPNGNLDLIAVLDLEDYMLGVLPNEMPATWPAEALKAQAVASRTYAIKKLEARVDQPFQLDSTTNDQVYKFASQSYSKELTDKLKTVLAETNNQVLKDNKGHVVHSYYHSDCGGQTEVASAVWSNSDKDVSVKDPNCPSGEFSHWKYSVSMNDLKEKLKSYGKVEKIRIASYTPTGRVDKIQLINSWGEDQKITSQKFREMIGYTKLKSTKFEYKVEGDNITFNGSGHGHGVGLCQHGSKELAKSNKNYKEILKHYFPNFKLESL